MMLSNVHVKLFRCDITAMNFFSCHAGVSFSFRRTSRKYCPYIIVGRALLSRVANNQQLVSLCIAVATAEFLKYAE